MGILKRLFSLLLALLVIAVFYVSAVLLEGGDSKQEEQFIVEAASLPLEPGAAQYEGGDPQALADAFGVPLPVPESFVSGVTRDSRYHAYPSRQVSLEGGKAAIRGVRPASAAPSVLPGELLFTASDKALLGYPLLQAQAGGRTVYALVMEDAAFYIVPTGDEPGGFSLLEPRL